MNDSTQFTATEELAELIARKLDVVRAIAQLASLQQEIVGEGDMTRLMALLHGKQKLITILQQLERQLDPYRDQSPESRPWRTPQERQTCLENVTRCEAILREVMQLEKEAETEMVQRRDALAQQLEGAQTASEASSAYAWGALPVSGGFDLSCEG